MISRDILSKKLIRIKLSRSCPPLSHLFFADDSLLFLKASTRNYDQLLACLRCFCEASGMATNLAKSGIIFSANMDSVSRDNISSLLNIPQLDQNAKYLGLPSWWGLSKKAAFNYILERNVAWMEKTASLSSGGRY